MPCDYAPTSMATEDVNFYNQIDDMKLVVVGKVKRKRPCGRSLSQYSDKVISFTEICITAALSEAKKRTRWKKIDRAATKTVHGHDLQQLRIQLLSKQDLRTLLAFCFITYLEDVNRNFPFQRIVSRHFKFTVS